MSERSIADELRENYQRARYQVDAGDRIISFRIGEIPAPTDIVLAAHRAEIFALVTAFNPFSVRQSAAENRRRSDQLKTILDAEGWKHLPGCGADDAGAWETEKGFFVLDISADAAVRLGQKFDQNAVVCGRRGAAARLIWCR